VRPALERPSATAGSRSEPGECRQDGEVRTGLDAGAEPRAVPRVAEGVPEPGGVGRHRPELAARQPGPRRGQRPGAQGAPPRDSRRDEHGGDGEEAGVAEHPARQ
jgi:hypothetical protein